MSIVENTNRNFNSVIHLGPEGPSFLTSLDKDSMKYIFEEDELKSLMLICAAQGAVCIVDSPQKHKCAKEIEAAIESELDKFREVILEKKRQRGEIINP